MFAIITLIPFLLIGAAVLAGGIWAWGPLVYMTVLVATMDRLIAAQANNADQDAEFPAGVPLLIALGFAHFCAMLGTLWAVAGPSGMAVSERVALAVGAGLMFGQISHPVAHELIHKPKRWMHRLGKCIYTSLLAGHHASAHLLIHHVHVGSDLDPNSAPRGETLYRYMVRATRQSFKAALRAETERRKRAGKAAYQHPFVFYVTGGVGAALAVYAGFGWIGLAAFLSIVTHAQVQILMSDYVQHYGLRRRPMPNGRLEPVGPHHSWNAPDVFSSFLMVNAPRHSDHHVAPQRAYPALQLEPDRMPYLPHGIPIMGAMALVPKLWFRVMNPLCDSWQVSEDGIGKPLPARSETSGKSSGQPGTHLAQSRHAPTVPPLLYSGSDRMS